jgi:energy-converting hydrogenase B subunit D
VSALAAIMLTLVAIGGAVVVWTGDPQRQAVQLAVFGALLSITFLVLQAPDVALSQIAVGSAVVPLMVLLTVRTVRNRRRP